MSIYTLTTETPRIDELAGADVDVLVDQKRQRLDLRVVRRLRSHIASWRPDIVHGFLYDGNLYSRLAAWGVRVPVLNSERNDNYALSLAQRLGYRLTSMLCDGIVANSYAGAEFARRLHGPAAGAVDVVWNGIDVREVERRVAGSWEPAKRIFPGADVKRLCMVASIKPQKDHPLALRVLRRLVDRDPAWRLICVGEELSDGVQGYKKHVLAERERLGLEAFVKFVGHRRDVPEIMSSSDMLLVTSLHEGFPNVVLEAMACGTPVVSTEYSDVRRILPAAQVVRARAEQDVADAVLRCYPRRAQIAQAQRNWVGQNATASASAHALLAVYAKYTTDRAAIPVGNGLRRGT